MTVQLVLPTYQLLPYERRLAERELGALRLNVHESNGAQLVVDNPSDPAQLARLTYVARAVAKDGLVVEPDAARMEAVHRAARGKTDSRQATRYHLHGIHEYKGKFNPQVVRSFANLLGLEPGDWLLDPFCGSGTALVEGLSMGANVHGIDRSPLAVHLARTKVAAVRHRWPEKLAVTLESWMQSSFAQIERSQQQERVVESGLVHLDAGSRAYLERWFTSPALAAMSAALYARSRLDPLERALVDVAISSLCRSVSLQLPEDLRIRRRPDGYVAPPIAEALSEAVRNIAVGLRELAEAPFSNAGTGSVHLGSASSARAFRELRGRASRCAVITSPPYATALPYIDTDRLSITLLGLAPASRMGDLERRLFGSREWSTAEAREWGERRATNQDALPQSIVALCAELHEAGQAAGFRRKAVPGLLYRYFVNMRDALSRIRSILRSGEEAIFIVGDNRTSGANGDARVIETAHLSGEIARQAGFVVRESITLDAWPRFGLHHANGINSETAVWLVAS